MDSRAGGFEVALGEGVGLRELRALRFGVLEVGEEEDLLVGEGGNEVGLIAVDALQPKAEEHVERVGLLDEIDLLLDFFRREAGGVGGLRGEGGGAGDCEGCVVVALEGAIQVKVGFCVFANLFSGHHGEDVGFAGGCPC
jgi:hypothetical protein